MDIEGCTTLPKSLQPGSGVSWESDVDDDNKDASAAMHVLSDASTVFVDDPSAESAH